MFIAGFVFELAAYCTPLVWRRDELTSVSYTYIIDMIKSFPHKGLMFNPPHPGEVLKELYLPEGMSVSEAAKKLGVSRQTLSAIINGRAGISAEMAMRLSKALGTSPDLWLGMQMKYDLWQAKQKPPKGVQKLAA